jgi:hypothetical protein
MKSCLFTEACPVEVPTATVYPRENVGSKVVVPQQIIFLHFLKQLQFICLQFLAANALHCRLLNDEFTVHGSLTKWTSVGFTGKLPKWFQLV